MFQIFSDEEGSIHGKDSPNLSQHSSPYFLHTVDEEEGELQFSQDKYDADILAFFDEKSKLATANKGADIPKFDVNRSSENESGRQCRLKHAQKDKFMTDSQSSDEETQDNKIYLSFLDNSSDPETPEVLTARTPRDQHQTAFFMQELEDMSDISLPQGGTSNLQEELISAMSGKLKEENKSKPPKLKDMHSSSLPSPRSQERKGSRLEVKAPKGVKVNQTENGVELIMKANLDSDSSADPSRSNHDRQHRGKSLAELDNLRKSLDGKSKYVSEVNIDISPHDLSSEDQPTTSVSPSSSHTEEVSLALSKSQSVRADIQKLLTGYGSSTESQSQLPSDRLEGSSMDSEDAFNSTEHCDDEVAATIDAMNTLLAKQKEEGGDVEDLDQTSFSESEATFTPIDVPRQHLTSTDEEWMNSTSTSLMASGNDSMQQSFARSTGKLGMQRIAEAEEKGVEVTDAIKAAVKEQLLFPRSSSEDGAGSSETTDSCRVQQGGSNRSSLNISFDDEAPLPPPSTEDELLALLDEISKQGENMKSELEMAYAREAVFEHSMVMEEDGMTHLLAKLKTEVETLREENSLLQQEVQSSGNNSDEAKDKIQSLQNIIENLRTKISRIEKEKERKKAKMKSTSMETDRKILIHQPTQTLQTSLGLKMRDKGIQIHTNGSDKSIQVVPQLFRRSRFTSTDDLKLKVRSTGVQVIGLMFSKDMATQVKDLIRTRTCGVQAYSYSTLKDMCTQTLSIDSTKKDSGASYTLHKDVESTKPSAMATRMLDRMLSQISALTKERTVAEVTAATKLHLEGLQGYPESRDKWQQLAMTPLSNDPLVLQLQKSLASAALENEVLHSRVNRGPTEAPDRVTIESNTWTEQSQPLGKNTKPANEMDQLKVRISSLERTLNNAQLENTHLTDKLDQTLQVVKENKDTSPRKLTIMEMENEVLKNKLAKVQEEKGQLEEVNKSLVWVGT